MNDQYNLNRFVEAQERDYKLALSEIKNGYKQSHWIWYIFPQLADLGYSATAKFYGIKDKDEAIAYLNNNYLKNNLIEISKALYEIDDDITNILGYPDDLKLKSCMTLFNYIDPSISIFKNVLNKFYAGQEDQVTLNLLNKNL